MYFINSQESLIRIYDYIRPILDVGILTFLLYKSYELIVRTNSSQVIKSAIIIALAYVVVLIFKLSTLEWILNLIAPALVAGFAIVFQPEIRKVLLKLGQTEWFVTKEKIQYTVECVDSVLDAAEALSSLRRGMLVVFTRKTRLDDIIESGEQLSPHDNKKFEGKLNVSGSLLLTIFKYDTPLHDGACVIQNNSLVAAGCFLPLSENYSIKKTYGTRHRAALGVCEKYNDCVVVVVSEESGAMSLVFDSELHYDLSREQMRNTLIKLLNVNDLGAVINGEQ